MAKKQSRFLVQQKAAVIAFIVLIVGVLGYLSYLMLEDAPLGEFVEGEHYQLIENPRRIRSDKIEIIEFFSYACIHCYRFDPDLEDWVAQQGDTIEFIRLPAVASDYWRMLGRAYYTMEELDLMDRHHNRLFRAIHEGRQVFNSPAALFAFFDSADVSAEDFQRTYNSASVSSSISRADQMARRMRVATVPSIVVQGKYLVRSSGAIGPKRMLDVMDHLVEKELAERTTDPSE